MLIVLYSLHMTACGFYGIGINIDSFRFVGQYPVLYISLYNCVNFPIGPSSNAFSISAAIKFVPVALVALLFFYFFDGMFHLCRCNGGTTFIISLWSCDSVISIIVIPYTQSKCLLVLLLKTKHVAMFVHCSRCLRSVSTIPYPLDLFMHLSC